MDDARELTHPNMGCTLASGVAHSSKSRYVEATNDSAGEGREKSWRRMILAATSAGLLACAPGAAPSADLTHGASEKVCQLTGRNDWATGIPTTTQTQQYGLVGTDLGYPVEHDGRLALFFGDSRAAPPIPEPRDELGPPDDAVGWITSRTPPTQSQCTDLTINHETAGLEQGRALRPPLITPSPVPQGIFNVPTGGVSSEGWLYAFFWTRHCNIDRPVNQPCPTHLGLTKDGIGLLARSSDDGRTFTDYVPTPYGFVYSTAVDATVIPELPDEQRLGIYIFAVPKYRESVPYLAYVPAGFLGDPSAWNILTGLGSDGKPRWVTGEEWQRRSPENPPPGQPDLFSCDPRERNCDDPRERQRCVGEFSITWNQPLQVWLLLYNCDQGKPSANIQVRIADAPWGPWSKPEVILDADRDGSWCTLLMKKAGTAPLCEGRGDDWPGQANQGGFYAPFAMERYTTPLPADTPGRRRAMVYWLLSTWNPYQVVVMRTVLEVDSRR